jgi:hypothetical protein
MKRPARDFDKTFPSPATLPFITGAAFDLKTGTVAFSGLDFSDEVRPVEIFKSDSQSLRLLFYFRHTSSPFFRVLKSLSLPVLHVDVSPETLISPLLSDLGLREPAGKSFELGDIEYQAPSSGKTHVPV